MSNWTETFRGVIYPWNCDHMGHMNVMYYVNFFDQAACHLISACGFKWSEMGDRQIGFADVKHVIEYKAEQKVGNPIIVQSGIVRRGRTSLVAAHRMINPETDELAATMQVTTILFDLEARQSLPLPEENWPLLDNLLVELE